MTVHIPVPRGQAVTNLLGALGLIAIVLAIGGLAGMWWALLAGGAFAVGLAVLAQNAGGAQAAAAAAAPAGKAPTRELHRVA